MSLATNTNTTASTSADQKKTDSKFSKNDIKTQAIKDLIVTTSFSVGKSLNKPTKTVIKKYINKFKNLNLDDCTNQFLIDDVHDLEKEDYGELFYKTADFYGRLDCLTSNSTIVIIEQDECYVNHVKTIAAVIQFCLTALTYALNEKMNLQQPFVLSDLTYIPGFYMKVLPNGIIDFENSHFINLVDNSIIEKEWELFNFNFKMLIEGYSSPNKDSRILTANQKNERDDLINRYLENDNENLEFKKFEVYDGDKTTSHTVELRPVITYRHICSVGNLCEMIRDYHLTQGIIYKELGRSRKGTRNSEHGNGKCPIFSFSKKCYEICYLFNENGSPRVIDYSERNSFMLKEHKHKIVTESRHYGDDVRCTFKGYNATFGNGNQFDILLIK